MCDACTQLCDATRQTNDICGRTWDAIRQICDACTQLCYAIHLTYDACTQLCDACMFFQRDGLLTGMANLFFRRKVYTF